jgi:hypothetical protein
MKVFAVIVAALALPSVAHADARLDGRVELMKLTYACGSRAEYKTARDSALRAEQMATVGTPDEIVLSTDRGLRDGTLAVKVDKSKCGVLLEQMRFEMKARGY